MHSSSDKMWLYMGTEAIHQIWQICVEMGKKMELKLGFQAEYKNILIKLG